MDWKLQVRVNPGRLRESQPRDADERAFIGISIGSKVTHDKFAFGLILDWARSNLCRFDVLVGDHLNRHNHMAFDGMTEADAIRQSEFEGKKIREFVIRTTEHRPCTPEVISSASLYRLAGFTDRLTYFEDLYARYPKFKILIDQAVDTYLARKRLGPGTETVRNHCRSYQLEELVLFEYMAERGYSTLVYPGPHLPIMKAFADRLLPGVAPLLEKYTLVELRLHRNVDGKERA